VPSTAFFEGLLGGSGPAPWPLEAAAAVSGLCHWRPDAGVQHRRVAQADILLDV